MTGDVQKTAAQDLSTDPAETWREVMGMSTSAQLAHARAEVTALTRELLESREETLRAEKERNDAVRRSWDLEQVREELAQRKRRNEGDLEDIQALEAERDGVREELARQAATCEDLRATIAIRNQDNRRLTAELESALRALGVMYAGHVAVVAEQDCGLCAACGQPIVRSQAVKALPDTTTKPAWIHAVCP